MQRGYLSVDSDLYVKLFPVAAAAKVREGGEPGEPKAAKEIEEEEDQEEGSTAMASKPAATSTGNVVQATKEMAAARETLEMSRRRRPN